MLMIPTKNKKKLTNKELENNKIEKAMNGVAIWASFYRANPHRFTIDYLNIALKKFQAILLNAMMMSTNLIYLAARGQGKTFLLAIYCCVRCILYPETNICIASKRRSQATAVLEKIQNILMPNSPNLVLEIKEVKINQSDSVIRFKNGSSVKVVTASDTARSNRANVLIIDEYRLVDQNIIATVLRKFLTAPRQPKYLEKAEYAHLTERNIEMYASSCWYQSNWAYEKAKTYCANLVDDKRKYFICGLPYQLSIMEHLLSPEQIEDEMSESDFSPVTFSMEMECLWFSDADGGLYSYADISSNRKIKYPFYPKFSVAKVTDRRLRINTKQSGEIRILSGDIALMSSAKRDNDATSIFINQMLLTANDRYTNNIVYTENNEGQRTDEEALTIRRLFDDFECDYLVIDGKGIGLGVLDMLMADLYDANTGITYPALSCCNNDEIAKRCKVKNAQKKIWVVQGSPEFNSQCALGLREAFKQNRVRLLLSEYDAEEVLQEIVGYNKMTAAEKLNLQLPYIHTSLLINELVNLEYETKNNVIRVKEKAGMRKDRYSSLSYNIYVANALERDRSLSKQTKTVTDLVMQFKAPQIKKKY